jgi:serine/threonine-protein kinase
VPLALGAVSLGLAAGWGLSLLRPKSETPKPSVSVHPSSGPAPISLAEVPVLGNSARVQSDKLLACVAGYMPPDTFARPPDVSWVCTETSPREGAEKLRSAVVGSTPRSGPSTAMKIYARLGWYDMAAFAVVRAGCCPDAPELKLEGTSRSCTSMVGALNEIGEAVVAGKPLEAALKRYRTSIHCELNMDRAYALGRKERPVGGEDAAFLELVNKLETH